MECCQVLLETPRTSKKLIQASCKPLTSSLLSNSVLTETFFPTITLYILYIKSICGQLTAILGVVQVNQSDYFLLQIFVLTKKLYYRVMEAMLLAVS